MNVITCIADQSNRSVDSLDSQTPPALTLAVNSNSERGLLGIALRPNFATNGYVYLYWTCRGAEAAADCEPRRVHEAATVASMP